MKDQNGTIFTEQTDIANVFERSYEELFTYAEEFHEISGRISARSIEAVPVSPDEVDDQLKK